MYTRRILILLLALLPTVAGAQEPRSSGAEQDGATFSLGHLTVPAPFRLTLADPPSPQSFFLRSPLTDWVGDWAAARRAELDAAWAWQKVVAPLQVVRAMHAGPVRTRPDSATAAPKDSAGLRLPGLGEHADLGLRIQGRGELGGAWSRYQPCAAGGTLNCNPGLFPQINPDIQFGLLVGGTIAQRVHVSVDYDQRREFDAANNINVYYQGLEDEILQRIEVGDVSIQLPPSRYITEGLPAGNFGFKTAGDLGPMRFQAVWAQQKGDVTQREFRLGGGGTTGLVQDMQLVLDDADYVKGQFFFLVHPDSIAGAPHFDVTKLTASNAPAALAPQTSELFVYRDDGAAASREQTAVGYTLSDAVSADGTMKRSGQYRLLDRAEDYYLHPSGLWLMLRQPLQADQSLAVGFRARDGRVVGTLNIKETAKPSLLLIRGAVPTHQPGQGTWPFEMHNVYRVDNSSGVDRASVTLGISLGDEARGFTYRDVGAERLTLLRFFGLDESGSDNRIDIARVFQPGTSGLGGDARITGTFIVFPTLRPFAQPPPLPSVPLDAEQTRLALGADSNAVIYEHSDPVMRDGGARFRLNLSYRVRTEGLISSFNLGAFGLREGSERIFVDGRQLERDRDYSIDYEIGAVTLNDAQGIFGSNPNAEIKATWEQQSLFTIAPTTVLGLNSSFRLGPSGELTFMALHRSEKSIMLRPQLGNEPSSIVLGGVSGRYAIGADWLDRAFDALPLLRSSGGSTLNVNGEVAFSQPTPNTRGDTYLDDFENGDEVPLSLSRHAWRLGSRPENVQGAESVLPVPLGVDNAAALVWQHDYQHEGLIGGPVSVESIDRLINVHGNTPIQEQVLYVTFGDTVAGGTQKSWRSLTTPLSTTGRDMTRTEYLEFYLYAPSAVRDAALVIDIGTVSEDAFYFDPTAALGGTVDGRLWGQNQLDEEARSAERELWGDVADARGLWNQPCTAERGRIYPLSDPMANCLRGNGVPDTEDLDGNGVLDGSDGAAFRYVVPLGSSSPYLVRDTGATGTNFRLYRIPLRGSGAIALNGATDAAWRYIKHMRFTFAGATSFPTAPNFALTRARFVGSRWTKRDVTGVQRGVAGDTLPVLASSVDFRVGPVSQVTDGSVYNSPPGVKDEGRNANTGVAGATEEVNERSLRLAYDRLEPDHRAEVYFRYPQQPRNLMTYRDLRFWAVARAGDFGPAATQSLLVKAGTDAQNYYLYRTRLTPAVGEVVRTADWGEQRVIQFEKWFELKARAEEELIARGGVSPRQPVTVWSEDSTYAIVLADRALAPNLASIRELSFAVYNGDMVASAGEVWIDDMRLGGGLTDTGLGSHVAVDLRGGGFLTASLSYGNRGAIFQQMNQDPSYLGTTDLNFRSSAQLGNLTPTAWGIDMPLDVSHVRSSHAPMFLDRSDLRAEDLDDLRPTGSDATRVGLSLRKRTPTANPWLGALVDGAAVNLGYSTGTSSASTATNETSGITGAVTYARQLPKRELDVTPGLFEALLRALVPARLESSEVFARLTQANLRWTPEAISFSSTYGGQESRAYRYRHFLRQADDTVAPIESARRALDNRARLALHPFESFTAVFDANSSRDLLPPERATTRPLEREALEAARRRVAGTDLGWETNRSLGSTFVLQPLGLDWLQPMLRWQSVYRTNRSPSYLELLPVGSHDTTAILQRDFQVDRQFTRGVSFDAGRLYGSLFHAGDSVGSLIQRGSGRLLRSLMPLELTWNDVIRTQFEREVLNPGFRYQFGWGDRSALRFLSGDTATVTSDRAEFRARSGVRLPLTIDIGVDYAVANSDFLDGSGGLRSQHERSWPSVQFRWGNVPLPAGVRGVVTQLRFTTGFEERQYSTLLGASSADAAPQERGTVTREVPVQLAASFGTRLSTVYTLTMSEGVQNDPSGDSESRQANHSIQLTGTLPPLFRSERFDKPLQASLRYSYTAQQQCGFRGVAADTAAVPSCVAFVDAIGRGFSFTLDTALSTVNVGLQMSYNSNARFTGTRDKSSQFQLGLFGQVQLDAGRMPEAGLPGGMRGR